MAKIRKKEVQSSRKHSCNFCSQHISARMSKYVHLLKKLINARGTKRNEVIRDADLCFVKILCECALNVLKGRVPLTKTQLKRLRPHANTLVKLSDKKTSQKEQRDILRKKGGFLPIILPALISTLGSMAGDTISKLIHK